MALRRDSLDLSIAKLSGKDPKAITSAGCTIARAFSADPLVHWLRLDTPSWSELRPDTLAFQAWRMRVAMLGGRVYYTDNIGSLQCQLLQRSPRDYMRTMGPTLGHLLGNPGGVAILHPSDRKKRKWLSYYLGFFSLLKEYRRNPLPTNTPLQDRRWDTSSRVHEESLRLVRGILPRRQKFWYIEVLAIDPLLQRQGMGRRMMVEIIRLTGDEPLVLECTWKENINFYMALGFEVIETVTLTDTVCDCVDAARYWVMLRNSGKGI
ncbi:hypothetical protein BDV23DRAFT_182561 [Aspergillus alliaceus]|uniref:N-acetyltransferase domain-containing protein n=1 Tax=Petromyces alliaceus TaxID=209559 RepID=A0A5N7CBI4_PETAA|nr:hypothetical protein BDV23DRAFT_182561 [Aspergillus alliaceus]